MVRPKGKAKADDSRLAPPRGTKANDARAMPPPPRPLDTSDSLFPFKGPNLESRVDHNPTRSAVSASATPSPPEPKDDASAEPLNSWAGVRRSLENADRAYRRGSHKEAFEALEKGRNRWEEGLDEAVDREGEMPDRPSAAVVYEFLRFRHLVDKQALKLATLAEKLLEQKGSFTPYQLAELKHMYKAFNNAAKDMLSADDIDSAAEAADRERKGMKPFDDPVGVPLGRLEDLELRYRDWCKRCKEEPEWRENRSKTELELFQLLCRQMQDDLKPRAKWLKENNEGFDKAQKQLIERVYAEAHGSPPVNSSTS